MRCKRRAVWKAWLSLCVLAVMPQGHQGHAGREEEGGDRDTLDKAIAAFSVTYADQNERDHAALDLAVKQGKVPAVFEETR